MAEALLEFSFARPLRLLLPAEAAGGLSSARLALLVLLLRRLRKGRGLAIVRVRKDSVARWESVRAQGLDQL